MKEAHQEALKVFNKLKVNPKNPRTISKKQFASLKKSLKDFPEMLEKRPIVYDEGFVVIGGNMRLRALQELEKEGFEIKADYFKSAEGWTENQKREFVIKDNIEMGEWDDEILANEWSDLPLEEWGIDTSGWDRDVEEDEPPEVSKEPAVSKLGEVYQLGRHRLMCGDSTKIEDVEKLLDGQKADMIFTDPPYNVNYKGKAGSIKNDNFKTAQEFYQFLYDAISAFRPFVGGDVYICMSSSELHTLQKAFIDCGGHWSTFIIWVKDRFTLGRSNYHRQYEPILYGWFDGSSHWWSGNRKLGDVYKDNVIVGEAGRPLLYADGLDTDIWEFDKPDKSKDHPTTKPVKLCARGIYNSSKGNGVVLDTFGGSGSTLIACEQLNRICYMMELDEKYVDVIRKRYAKFIGRGEEWENQSPKI